MTLITAHAGCDGTRPGSIENLTAALHGHADCIEFDLRYYDGRVLLSHDPIRSEQLDAYLTLEDTLDRLADSSLRFNCDLKEEAVFLPTLRCAQARSLAARLDFTGLYPLEHDDAAAQYRVFWNIEHIPGIAADAPLSGSEVQRILHWFHDAQARHPSLFGINADYQMLQEGQAELLQQHGVPVMCWTVDDGAVTETLLHTGVHAITTNNVLASVKTREILQLSR